MIANFHLSRSMLLVLVSTFVGRERILRTHREDVMHGYRFFCDSMLRLLDLTVRSDFPLRDYEHLSVHDNEAPHLKGKKISPKTHDCLTPAFPNERSFGNHLPAGFGLQLPQKDRVQHSFRPCAGEPDVQVA
jgi:hypothetical protein